MKRLTLALDFAKNKLAIRGKFVLTLAQITDNAASRLDRGEIEISQNISRDLQIESLFHELVHFWQWQNGKLTWNGSNWMFHGQIQKGNYWYFGHEIEARRMARELMIQWNKENRMK
jgi:hypothetical protein